MNDARLKIEKVIADFEREKNAHDMLTADLPRRAELLAKAAHDGQVDKANIDYIEHPKKVASFVATDEEKAVAFLHDTLEDTAVTVADLRKIGMPNSVIAAVEVLTHDKNQPYFDYLAEVKKNTLARTVKLADLKHNSDTSRLINLTAADQKRLVKYQKAIAFLQA